MTHKNFTRTFFFLACLLSLQMAPAQPGVLDPTFSSDGFTTIDFLGNTDEAQDMVIQPDGKILLAGTCNINFSVRFGLVRLNSNGTADNTFGGDGMVDTEFAPGSISFGQCMALQPDGKILVAGSTNDNVGSGYVFAIARYLANGTLDSTFSNDGLLTYDFSAADFCNAIALQPDGKIVIACSSVSSGANHISLFRFHGNGNIDLSFSSNGAQVTPLGLESSALAVAIQSDGKIVVAGKTGDGFNGDVVVLRYDASGSLDWSFDGDGYRILALDAYDDYATDILQQPDGKLLIGGVSNIAAALVRFNSNGSLDNTFSGDGIVTTQMNANSFDVISDIALDANGKIVAAGYSQGSIHDIAVYRFNANGTPDNLFSLDGKVSTDIAGDYDYLSSMGIQTDGKIVVAGYTPAANGNDMLVVRYQGVCANINTPQTISICAGESVTVGGNTHSSAGVYTDAITLPSGCDSMVTTTLIVKPNSNYTQNLTISSGQSVTVGSNTYSSNGTYTDVLVAANGCDSVVTTNLTVLTGIEDMNGHNPSISVAPVPFNSELRITGTEAGDDLLLLDITGKVVMRASATAPQTVLPTEVLQPGIYFLLQQAQHHSVVMKVVKNGQ